MKILGVDPSTVSTGWAIIDGSINKGTILKEYGVIKLKGSLIEKVGEFYSKVFMLIKKHEIECIAIETPFLGKNIATYGKLSMLRGALYILSDIFDLNIIELSPAKVKQLTTAKGNATKKEVASVLKKRYSKLPDKLCDDITDAIAVAYSGLIMSQTRSFNEEKLLQAKGKKRR